MSDPLRPSVADALGSWSGRVRDDHQQVDRCREIDDPADFYAPVADRFRLDPRRVDDPVLNVLLDFVQPDERWLDVGAGGGRYALPIALAAREVVAVDPSPAMLDILREGMHEHGIENIAIHRAAWPMTADLHADASLMAHVGYDIAEIGPFLDALEAASRGQCLAIMGESAMTTVAALLWQPVHGEARVRLPALPELLVLLLARGRLPEVRLVDRQPVTFDTRDEALDMARRQLWLREGSEKDDRLRHLVAQVLTVRDGRWSFDWNPTKIGIVRWAPL